MIEALGWRAHYVVSSEAGQAAFSSCVRPMELRPGLLKQTNPQFTITAGSESWLTIWFAWQEVVDNDRCFITINVKAD